jgi:bisphosphoglycerate-independent phosphoglycerate mutase (AlkP superfamily)
VIQNLARMIRQMLEHLDLGSTTVIMTSDHGNIEDLSTRSHTLNSVPTIVWGMHSRDLAARIKSLIDITPAIVKTLAG